MTGINRIVVKIGGKAAEIDALVSALAGELRELASEGTQCLLVHGGGVTISELQGRYNISPQFIDGLRQTTPKEMPLVDMALAGRVNKHLVRIMRNAGLDAWGLCGADAGVISAESTSKGGSDEKDSGQAENRTGTVTQVRTEPLELLWQNGFFPVLAPPSTDSFGRGINVNADEAAFALAASLKSDVLVFFSDVPGVLEQGLTIATLTPDAIENRISNGVIAGGMIPKVRAAAAALSQGVGAVCIGEYTLAGSLSQTLSGKSGTTIFTDSPKKNSPRTNI